ncbi:MAG: endolytic transglycosylase MltG [Ruminococcus sp.]|nr:endolytic transglycosylase MltG [Ruminococcus sp.]
MPRVIADDTGKGDDEDIKLPAVKTPERQAPKKRPQGSKNGKSSQRSSSEYKRTRSQSSGQSAGKNAPAVRRSAAAAAVKTKSADTARDADELLSEHFGKGVIEDKPYRSSAPDRERPKKKKPAAASSKKASGSKKKKRKRVSFNASIFGGIILVTIILTVSLILAVVGISVGREYYGIGKSDDPISFNIPEGYNNDQITDLLIEKEVINGKYKKLFKFAMKIQKTSVFYPGDITLSPSDGYAEIIKKLSEPRESYESVTITFTEGEYLSDIAAKLEEAKVCSAQDFLFDFNRSNPDMEYTFEDKLGSVPNSFYAREGYFFPDTYEFYVGDAATNITRIIKTHFDEKMTTAMYNRMEKQGLSLNEVMTLASIVQMEAGTVEDMPIIASVFLNRLNDPETFPQLQSDTTSNYVKNVIEKEGGDSQTIESYRELYDTYICKGLPAGPICNPGIDAINAVLYPAETDYYYFCNDLETGETFYAETLEEHEENLVKAGLVEAPETDDDDNDEEE